MIVSGTNKNTFWKGENKMEKIFENDKELMENIKEAKKMEKN